MDKSSWSLALRGTEADSGRNMGDSFSFSEARGFSFAISAPGGATSYFNYFKAGYERYRFIAIIVVIITMPKYCKNIPKVTFLVFILFVFLCHSFKFTLMMLSFELLSASSNCCIYSYSSFLEFD